MIYQFLPYIYLCIMTNNLSLQKKQQKDLMMYNQCECYIHNDVMYFNRPLIAYKIFEMQDDTTPDTTIWDRLEMSCNESLSYGYTWSARDNKESYVTYKITKITHHKLEGKWHMPAGYWHPKKPDEHKYTGNWQEPIEDSYPLAIFNENKWPGQIKYMKALLIIENSYLIHQEKHFYPYKSPFSAIRFNSRSYWYKTPEQAISWPEHYLLYDIYMKNIKPSKEHYDLIIELSENLICGHIWKKTNKSIDMNELDINLYFLKYYNNDYLIRNKIIYFNETRIRREIEQMIDNDDTNLAFIGNQANMSFKYEDTKPQTFEIKVEGYWSDGHHYPKPICHHTKWPGQIKYMKALNVIENSYLVEKKDQTQLSHSQLEDLSFKSKEYILKDDIQYMWPGDFLLYYVYMYNVQPSKAHYDLIIHIAKKYLHNGINSNE